MQRFKNVILFIFLTSYIVSNSQEVNKNQLFKKKSYTFPYILNRPNKTWKLPKNLNEISGLSYVDRYRLACVQDEKGNIYIFNLLTGDIERKIDFEDDGDYEAIEIVKNDAWVLKSNGTLYKVNKYLNENEDDVEKYPTILKKKNDAEGLCYCPATKQLLIACKGYPFVDDKSGKNQKAIYQYDIKTNLLDLDPFLVIRLDIIKDLKNFNTITKWGVELLAYLNDAKGDLTFQPSAIAIHPVTSDIYILASVGHLMMIYSSEKELQCIVQLEKKVHPQPEGICFSPDGTLYISSEGKETSGRISVFTMNNQPLTNHE